MNPQPRLTRRELLRLSAAGAGALALVGAEWAAPGVLRSTGLIGGDIEVGQALANDTYIEVFPTSPLILSPFTESLPIPKALAPVPPYFYRAWTTPPGPSTGQQHPEGSIHQLWPSYLPERAASTDSTDSFRAR